MSTLLFNTENLNHQTKKLSTRQQLDQLKNDVGFIPHVFSAIASSDVALTAFLNINAQFAKTNFSDIERQIILLATSTENKCGYCVAGHTTFSESLKVPKEIVESMRETLPLNDKKLDALNQFTRAMVRDRARVSQQTINNFFEAGYTQEDVISVVLGISIKTFSNLVSIVMDIPLDKAFENNAWDPKIISPKTSSPKIKSLVA